MGGGGPNIWQEYRPIRGSVQWLLVQPSTCASLHVALLKMLLKNKNAALLTPKFAWSTVHTSNFFSKLSQCGVEYILPTRKPCSLSRVWCESSAGEFWSYRVHMLRGAVPVPPNVLAKNCLGWQVRYSAEGEGNGSRFQKFIQSRVASTGDSHHAHPEQHLAVLPCPVAMQVALVFLKDTGLWLPSGRGEDLSVDSTF